MEHEKKRYEQYCAVVGKNVIMEEQYGGGIRKLHCMHEQWCKENQGCRNHYIDGLHHS